MARKSGVPTVTYRNIKGLGLLVTGLNKTQIERGQRALRKNAQMGDRNECRKKNLLWSLAVRLVRRGKIRHHAKKKKK